MEIFKIGDKFIHFTNYGGVNRGTVRNIFSTYQWDFTNKCVYEKTTIFTTNGVSLNLDGTDGRIYRVESEMDETAAKDFESVLKRADAMKSRTSNRLIHNIDENKKT